MISLWVINAACRNTRVETYHQRSTAILKRSVINADRMLSIVEAVVISIAIQTKVHRIICPELPGTEAATREWLLYFFNIDRSLPRFGNGTSSSRYMYHFRLLMYCKWLPFCVVRL